MIGKNSNSNVLFCTMIFLFGHLLHFFCQIMLHFKGIKIFLCELYNFSGPSSICNPVQYLSMTFGSIRAKQQREIRWTSGTNYANHCNTFILRNDNNALSSKYVSIFGSNKKIDIY